MFAGELFYGRQLQYDVLAIHTWLPNVSLLFIIVVVVVAVAGLGRAHPKYLYL